MNYAIHNEDNLLAMYASLCRQEKEIADQKETIKKKLEDQFGQKEHVEKTELGTFKMVGRTSYEYSSDVKEASDSLKEMMQDEQEQGIAKPTITYSLRFNPAKE